MSKAEFFEKLNELLQVSESDRVSLIEEYESYFTEAMADGASEEEVVKMLESPEEIAATANDELGTKNPSEAFRNFVDEQVSAVKKGYETVIESEKMQEINEKVSEAITSSMDSVKVAFKKANEKIKQAEIDKKVSSAFSSAMASLGKLKDINFGESFDNFKMRYDNSKVYSFEDYEDDIEVVINDHNPQKLKVEVSNHSKDNIVIKALPSALKFEASLEKGKLNVELEESKILYSQNKRMLVLLPDGINSLKLKSNAELIIRELDVEDIEISNENKIDLREIDGASLVVKSESGYPTMIREVDVTKFEAELISSILSVKELTAEEANIKTTDGAVEMRDIDIEVFNLEAGNGPVTLRDIDGNSHTYKLGVGPKTIRDIDLELLTLFTDGGLLSIRNAELEVMDGDITGAMKTFKNVEVKEVKVKK